MSHCLRCSFSFDHVSVGFRNCQVASKSCLQSKKHRACICIEYCIMFKSVETITPNMAPGRQKAMFQVSFIRAAGADLRVGVGAKIKSAGRGRVIRFLVLFFYNPNLPISNHKKIKSSLIQSGRGGEPRRYFSLRWPILYPRNQSKNELAG